MNIKLSDNFNYIKLLRFTLPSMVMMVFSSVYGVVDGFFVSNFAGKTAFAALNFIFPFLMILGAVGFMFGTGGSALVAKTMGEGDAARANRYFSLIIYASIICGLLISILGLIFLRPVAYLLGARGQMLSDCVTYGRILLCALPFFVLQMEFQSFFITAEKPQLGLWSTVLSGVTNMVLDWVLVGILPWGLAGAALATAASQVIGGLIPLFYFSRKNDSALKLTKTSFELKALLLASANGASELMSNISMSLVSMLYNIQLLHHAGENGVAAYGVLMYVNFVFVSIFIGYSIGMAPIAGYHLGAENHKELKSLLKKSIVMIGAFSVSMLVFALILSRPLSNFFVGYDAELLEMTRRGFFIFSFSFLFAGFAIFSSGFFTALNDGLTSAVISFLRTLVFQSLSVLLLPMVWGLEGIWASVVVAEILAVFVSFLCILLKRNKFHYL